MTLTLVRVGQSQRGTFGVLRYQDIPFALTLEPPWRDNQRNLSCIPAGIYTCAVTRSPKFGLTYEITGIPGRDHVLFHRGNYLGDTEGCVLVAEEFSGTFDAPMIVSSERGFGEFMAVTMGQPAFQFEIFDCPKGVEPEGHAD